MSRRKNKKPQEASQRSSALQTERTVGQAKSGVVKTVGGAVRVLLYMLQAFIEISLGYTVAMVIGFSVLPNLSIDAVSSVGLTSEANSLEILTMYGFPMLFIVLVCLVVFCVLMFFVWRLLNKPFGFLRSKADKFFIGLTDEPSGK
jgi:hypothetical protein